jgi:hypothetical protein
VTGGGGGVGVGRLGRHVHRDETLVGHDEPVTTAGLLVRRSGGHGKVKAETAREKHKLSTRRLRGQRITAQHHRVEGALEGWGALIGQGFDATAVHTHSGAAVRHL